MPEGEQQQQQQQTPPAPWYADKLDAESVGYLQNRGLADKPADVVALETIRAHREAEKLIGVPANELVRLPKQPNDEAGWKAVYQRLGAPADAKDYDFANVKVGEKPLEQAQIDFLRASAATLHLSKDGAVQFAQAWAKQQNDVAAAAATERAFKLTEEKAALLKNWGANHDAFKVIAADAAKTLGVDPETVAALEGVLGYSKIMDMFLKIGQKTGESKFVHNPSDPTRNLTREGAQARKSELMADAAWVKRYMEGGVAEGREMTQLNTLIVGDDTEISRLR